MWYLFLYDDLCICNGIKCIRIHWRSFLLQFWACSMHCSKVSSKIKALEGVENCKFTKFPDQKQRYLIQIMAEKSKLHDFWWFWKILVAMSIYSAWDRFILSEEQCVKHNSCLKERLFYVSITKVSL